MLFGNFSLHSITKGQSESLTEGVKENLFSDWQAGIFLGMSSYEGDVHCFKEENINVFTEANFAFGLNAYRSINENIKVGVRYMNTKISGSDAALPVAKDIKKEDFPFKTKSLKYQLTYNMRHLAINFGKFLLILVVELV